MSFVFPSRLYAILDIETADARGLAPLDVADAWFDAGVRVVQLRAKAGSSGRMLELADALVERARRSGAIVIVNDRADVARMSGADGVHVGQDDLAPVDARAIVGATAVVGLSTHSEAQVRRACESPIDYVAIGPVFASATRPGAHATVGIAGVRAAEGHAAARNLPVVAIGGMTLAEGPRAVDAGASAVAVIAGLFEHDLRAIARAWLRALDQR